MSLSFPYVPDNFLLPLSSSVINSFPHILSSFQVFLSLTFCSPCVLALEERTEVKSVTSAEAKMSSTSTTIPIPAVLERSAGVEVNLHSSLNTIIISLITIFGGYLELQYQSQKKSPLEDHKNIMVAIYLNLFIYGMGLMAEFKLKTCCGPRFLSIIRTFTPLFGIFVVVLIMIILYPVLGFVVFIIWTLITLEAVFKSFVEIHQWLRPIFIRAGEMVTSCFNKAENPPPAIQENDSASIEANDLSRESELSV